jgi:hypothetical protein
MAAARGVLTLRGRLTLVGINYFDSNEAITRATRPLTSAGVGSLRHPFAL